MNIDQSFDPEVTEKMRSLFERGVYETPALRHRVNLLIAVERGEFSHYVDMRTNDMWTGFLLGCRALLHATADEQ